MAKAPYQRQREERETPQRAPRRAQQDSEFVDLELSKAEKEALKDFCNTAEELDATLEGFLADETKVTFRYDERNRCFVAFGFAAAGSENDGYILTGRGGSVTRAIRQLLYKGVVILDGDWASYHNRGGTPDGDDW